jgi:hypothetical protein
MYQWPALQKASNGSRPGQMGSPGTRGELFPEQFYRFPEIILVVYHMKPPKISRVRQLDQMYRSIFGKVRTHCTRGTRCTAKCLSRLLNT